MTLLSEEFDIYYKNNPVYFEEWVSSKECVLVDDINQTRFNFLTEQIAKLRAEIKALKRKK